MPSVDAMGKALRLEGRTLAIFFGRCQSCSLETFDRRKLAHPEGMTALLIVESRADQVPKSFLGLAQTAVIVDPKGTLARHMNVNWYPRIFVVSADLRI